VSIPLPRPSNTRPKTTEAVLFCAKEKKFARHVFLRTIEVLAENGHRQSTKFMFECACGEPRVWGSED
jgi:hypothetical protein